MKFTFEIGYIMCKQLDNYHTCSLEVKKQIDNIVSGLLKLLNTNLVGIYLTGSMVLDAFDENNSDIDMIIVIYNKLLEAQKIEVISLLLALKQKPCSLDIQFVIKDDFTPWKTTPVCHLFFNDYWTWIYERILVESANSQELFSTIFTSGEIIADFKLVKQSGICFIGIPIKQLFPDIPNDLYFDSITSKIVDFNVESDNDRQSSYLVLTLCRILVFKKTSVIVSKQKAAEWALNEMPSKFHPIILSSLHKKYGVGDEVSYTVDDAILFKTYILECLLQSK